MKKGMILVVDDNPVNQKVISAMIEKLGHSVEIVSDGLQAVAAVMQNNFDIIFMDCQMPVMDGFLATREIRKAEEGLQPRVPIIALTASVLSDSKGDCFSAGMDDFMSKLVMLAALKDIISKWCPEHDSNVRPSP